jgi:AAA domain
MARKPRRYLIDRLFPHTGVHLIGGPSGAGKTRWLFQTLIDYWEKGKEVLGYKSHPCPWLYIAGDRPLDDAYDTLEDLGYNPDHVRMYGAVNEGVREIEPILNIIVEANPKPELVVVEGLPFMCKGNTNDISHVSKFMTNLARTCIKAEIGIWGSCHSPKMKEDAHYDNPRQRVMGSVAWAACAGTIVLVEPVGHGSTEIENQRRLIVLPRLGASIYKDLQFNTAGRLVETEEGINDALFDAFLNKYKAGDTFKTGEAISALEGLMSHATIERILKAAITGGYVEKVGQGSYRVKFSA